MFASLPMYDHPDLRAGWDATWSEIREALSRRGIDAPANRRRSGDLQKQWRDPDLLLGQTCGLPYRAGLHEVVHLLGAFDFALSDTRPGHYRSVFVARAEDGRAWPGGFNDATLAYNDPGSHSGWYTATTAPVRFSVGPCTGSHAKSVHSVARGEADIAAIDAVTWRILSRFDPAAAGLKVIGVSAEACGLPLITAHPDLSQALQQALSEGIAGLAQSIRRDLGLRGFVRFPKSAYLALPIPPKPEAYARSGG